MSKEKVKKNFSNLISRIFFFGRGGRKGKSFRRNFNFKTQEPAKFHEGPKVAKKKEEMGDGCSRKFNCPPKPSVDTVSHRVAGFRPVPCSRRNQRRPDRSSGNIKCFDNGRVRDKGYTARCAAKVDRERACPLLPFPLAAKISR